MCVLPVYNRDAGRTDAAPLDLVGDTHTYAGAIDHQTGIARQLPLQPDDALSLDWIRRLQRYPLQIMYAKD